MTAMKTWLLNAMGKPEVYPIRAHDPRFAREAAPAGVLPHPPRRPGGFSSQAPCGCPSGGGARRPGAWRLRAAHECSPPPRSEEHTSELPSLEKLVCPLLLENKKT